MEFDQQKLQKLIQHYLISTVIIFFSYITLFLCKITFLFFFFNFKATTTKNISIDEVSKICNIQSAWGFLSKKEELTFTLK